MRLSLPIADDTAPYKERVGGSSPSTPTRAPYGHVAQLRDA
jgi:hypothetical protein